MTCKTLNLKQKTDRNKDTSFNISSSDVSRCVKVDANKFALKIESSLEEQQKLTLQGSIQFHTNEREQKRNSLHQTNARTWKQNGNEQFSNMVQAKQSTEMIYQVYKLRIVLTAAQ